MPGKTRAVDEGALLDDLQEFFQREDITSVSSLALDTSDDSETLFECAVRHNRCFVARVPVMQYGADIASLSRRHGENAMHNACRAGHVTMVETLLELYGRTTVPARGVADHHKCACWRRARTWLRRAVTRAYWNTSLRRVWISMPLIVEGARHFMHA